MTDADLFVAWLGEHRTLVFVLGVAFVNGVIKPLSDRIGPLW